MIGWKWRACALAIATLALGCRRAEHKAIETPWFADITDAVGLDFVHHAGSVGTYFFPEIMGSGCALFDYDGDGDLDIYFVNGADHDNGVVAPSAAVANRLFRRERNGTYVDVTASSGLGDTGYGMGVAVADVDGDDDLDVYVTNFGHNTFFRNDGDGTFTDVTAAAGFDDRRLNDWSCSATFFDYDRDGAVDLFVTNYLQYDPGKSCRDRAGSPDYCGPMAFAGVPDVLYHNNGDGTFTDVSARAGIGGVRARGLGVVCDDFNEDGSIDIFVANDGEANHLWVNQGDGTFRDEAMILGVALNEMGQAEASMGIATGDVDGDGHLDLFCTHLRNESNTFYKGSGANGFSDSTAVAGLGASSMDRTGFGTAIVDIDHDGALDVLVVNGRVKRGPVAGGQHHDTFWQAYAQANQVFINDGHAAFANLGARAGPFSSDVSASRGLATGDIDGDGDIDFLVSNGAGRARLYRNDAPKRGHWLIVQACVRGRRTPAIGAAIEIEAGGRRFRGTVRTDSSYLSARDGRVHFGVGAAKTIQSIAVRWPDGAREVFDGGGVDRYVRLEQGEGTVESRKPKVESPKPTAERRAPKVAGPSRASRDVQTLPLAPPMPDLGGAQKAVVEKVRAVAARVRDHPKSAEGWGILGMVYLAHGFAKEAAVCLRTAELLDGHDFRWPHLLSYALPGSELAAIVAALQRGLAIKPDFVAGHLRLAEALLKRADRTGTRAHYEAVIALDADNVHALLGLGRLDFAAGAFESAVARLERARAIDRDYKEVCAALSRVYGRLGRSREAKLVAARAKSLTSRTIDGDDPLVHRFQREGVDAASLVRRGTRLVRQGRTQAGLRLLRSAVETAPDTAVNYRALGAALTQAGDPAAGLVAIDRALTIDPDRPRIMIDRGIALNAAGRFDEAEACFARIIELDPPNTAAWYNLASVKARRGRIEEAIASFGRYVVLNPGDYRVYGNLATLHTALKKPDEAAAAFRKSLDYEPFAAKTYLRFARLLARESRRDEAIAVLREGLTHLPNHATLAAVLAQVTEAKKPG